MAQIAAIAGLSYLGYNIYTTMTQPLSGLSDSAEAAAKNAVENTLKIIAGGGVGVVSVVAPSFGYKLPSTFPTAEETKQVINTMNIDFTNEAVKQRDEFYQKEFGDYRPPAWPLWVQEYLDRQQSKKELAYELSQQLRWRYDAKLVSAYFHGEPFLEYVPTFDMYSLEFMVKYYNVVMDFVKKDKENNVKIGWYGESWTDDTVAFQNRKFSEWYMEALTSIIKEGKPIFEPFCIWAEKSERAIYANFGYKFFDTYPFSLDNYVMNIDVLA